MIDASLMIKSGYDDDDGAREGGLYLSLLGRIAWLVKLLVLCF